MILNNYIYNKCVLFTSLSTDFLSDRWVLLPRRRAGRCTVQRRTLKVDVFVRWLLPSRPSAPETPEPNSSDSCWRRFCTITATTTDNATVKNTADISESGNIRLPDSDVFYKGTLVAVLQYYVWWCVCVFQVQNMSQSIEVLDQRTQRDLQFVEKMEEQVKGLENKFKQVEDGHESNIARQYKVLPTWWCHCLNNQSKLQHLRHRVTY